jgi:hypothetical protein
MTSLLAARSLEQWAFGVSVTDGELSRQEKKGNSETMERKSSQYLRYIWPLIGL